MPTSDTPSYKSYLLRLRRAGPDAGWQCSLQDTVTGEDHRFADLAGMTAFLHDFTEMAQAGDASVEEDAQNT